MNENSKTESFFTNYSQALFELFNSEPPEKIARLAAILQNHNAMGGRVIVCGNGGSASIASHVTIDLMKAANISSVCFSDPAVLTCLANDFGYEQAYMKAIEFNASDDDIIILISSSGESQNIINAAQFCIKRNLPLITFSGFEEENRLRKFGDLSFYAKSNQYNHVETTHSSWLLAAIDFCIDSQSC